MECKHNWEEKEYPNNVIECTLCGEICKCERFIEVEQDNFVCSVCGHN